MSKGTEASERSGAVAWPGAERRTGSRIVLEHRFTDALIRAGEALGQMSGQPIRVDPPELRRHTATELLSIAGGPESIVVVVYVAISGPLSGHALLMLEPGDARRLAGLLLEGMGHAESPTTVAGELYRPDDLERSALEETGNVVIANFLNAFAPIDLAEAIEVSVPESVVEMAGAILDGILVELSTVSDTFLLAATAFHLPTGRIDLKMLVLPRPASLPGFSQPDRALPAQRELLL
jgi:chemotaxis protein CheC